MSRMSALHATNSKQAETSHSKLLSVITWFNLRRRDELRSAEANGLATKRMDYLGASELTIFSNRGSPLSGSQNGSSFSCP
jgi:hypothetical protein